MKKILVIILIFLCSISSVFAHSENKIKFGGNEYSLKYSAKDAEHNGYLNEYFKQGEGCNTWSEMVAIHHFPNVYSPINQAEAFRDYLGSINCPSALSIDEENNSATIDFLIIDGQKLPIILEFNIFKYEKSKECGSIAVQYAKRYSVANSIEIDDVKKEFEKTRKKSLKKIEKFKIPALINETIDEIKLNDLP